MKENKQHFFAEVMESSLGNFVAQTWDWKNIPEFGSLICVENNNQINLGVISQINTGTIDSSRYPFPYKKTEEELLSEQPQIFEFLRTTFRVQVIGYVDISKRPFLDGKNNSTNFERSELLASKDERVQTIFYQIPPRPCKIHSFVANVSKEIALNFFSKPDFMYLLFSFEKEISNLDELLLAILKQLADRSLLSETYVGEFYETLSLLVGNDYKRLKLFLKRANYLLKV